MTLRTRPSGSLALVVLAASFSLAAIPARTIADATLCDLAARPLDFANRHVRLFGTIEVGPEHFGLADDMCQSASRAGASVWLDYPDEVETVTYARGWSMQQFLDALRSGKLTGDGPPVQWQVPRALAKFDPKQREALNLVLATSKGAGVKVVVTGRYDYAGDGLLVRSSDGSFSLRSAYGHLNCCKARIVLESVQLFDEVK